MSNYRPDHWMIVKIEGSDPHYRVFGTWETSNPFNGDQWRLNSGITGVTEDDKKYYFEGHSGSLYECVKGTYGVTDYGQKILKYYSGHTNQFNPIEQPSNIMEMDWII